MSLEQSPQLEMLHEGRRGRHRLVLSGVLCASTASELEWTVALLCIDGAIAIELDLSRLVVGDELGADAVGNAAETCGEHHFELSLTPVDRVEVTAFWHRRVRDGGSDCRARAATR